MLQGLKNLNLMIERNGCAIFNHSILLNSCKSCSYERIAYTITTHISASGNAYVVVGL